MKQGRIPGVNIAHNTASRGYQGGELDEDSTPVSRPLNIAHNTLPQVFARMGLLPHPGSGLVHGSHGQAQLGGGHLLGPAPIAATGAGGGQARFGPLDD